MSSIFGFKHISIHALRKESDLDSGDSDRDVAISIHALRKESDLDRSQLATCR